MTWALTGSEKEIDVRIAIVVFPGFTALDAIGPFEVLNRLPGADLEFVAETRGRVANDSGAIVMQIERLLTELTDPDIVVVPGGPGTRPLAASPGPLVEWIAAAHRTTRFTTSVCTGSLLLGAAGLLDGLEATTHWAVLPSLALFGATPVSRRVVVQGKVITAAGVSAGIDMALHLAASLAGEDVARGIQLAIEYDPDPPFDSGSPDKADPSLVDRVRRGTAPVAAPVR